MMTSKINAIDILLVEDNRGDIELAKIALEDNKLYNRLFVVEDGLEALRFLKKEGEYHDAPTPDLILLDLNLPKMDGREVLRLIKSGDQLLAIPVVILTTSQAEEDVLKTYNLHANCYVTKPIDLHQFVKVVKSIEEFWMTIVVLPKKY